MRPGMYGRDHLPRWWFNSDGAPSQEHPVMADAIDDHANLRDLAMARLSKGAVTASPPPQDSTGSPERGRPPARKPRMLLHRGGSAATEAAEAGPAG
eukprot:7010028-Pyramimonas_sp.AAC.1